MSGTRAIFRAVKGRNIITPTLTRGLVAEARTARKKAGYTGFQKQEREHRLPHRARR